MKLTARGLSSSAVAALMGGSLLVAAPAQAADPVTINLIGINDFHGRIDANTVKFAGTVEQLRAENPSSSLLISAGDNVSASLFASSVQKDIPTIDVLNALELDASAAGNHEFDQGADDLTGRLSDAADFPFLSANT
ncbi:MAG: bifunctional metallophosphatase/5'-nucleotidase, partial [Aeromicrobium sp.]